MAAKLKDKRTSITTVRDQYLSFAIYPPPPLHFSLPLNDDIPVIILLGFLLHAVAHLIHFFCLNKTGRFDFVLVTSEDVCGYESLEWCPLQDDSLTHGGQASKQQNFHPKQKKY
jgi:hypothetical protein